MRPFLDRNVVMRRIIVLKGASFASTSQVYSSDIILLFVANWNLRTWDGLDWRRFCTKVYENWPVWILTGRRIDSLVPHDAPKSLLFE